MMQSYFQQLLDENQLDPKNIWIIDDNARCPPVDYRGKTFHVNHDDEGESFEYNRPLVVIVRSTSCDEASCSAGFSDNPKHPLHTTCEGCRESALVVPVRLASQEMISLRLLCSNPLESASIELEQASDDELHDQRVTSKHSKGDASQEIPSRRRTRRLRGGRWSQLNTKGGYRI
eukprot:scaffold11555_cov111-Cylindrotheca_fusiformis.AAC.2